jgi:hypothetical protein
MCSGDTKRSNAVLRARLAFLRQRPELLQALRLARARQRGRLQANTIAIARKAGNGSVFPAEQARCGTRDSIEHTATARPLPAGKLGAIEEQQQPREPISTSASGPIVTARMLQSVSLGLSHVQVCDGCEHPVCLKTREMLRKVWSHKQRCTQDPSTCKACDLWERTVQIHHRITAAREPPPK